MIYSAKYKRKIVSLTNHRIQVMRNQLYFRQSDVGSGVLPLESRNYSNRRRQASSSSSIRWRSLNYSNRRRQAQLLLKSVVAPVIRAEDRTFCQHSTRCQQNLLQKSFYPALNSVLSVCVSASYCVSLKQVRLLGFS